MIMNEPQFKIYGIERRKLKKELSLLKSFVKNFWHFHQLDVDMTDFYGKTDTYPMTDEKAKTMFEKSQKEIERLEFILNESYVK